MCSSALVFENSRTGHWLHGGYWARIYYASELSAKTMMRRCDQNFFGFYSDSHTLHCAWNLIVFLLLIITVTLVNVRFPLYPLLTTDSSDNFKLGNNASFSTNDEAISRPPILPTWIVSRVLFNWMEELTVLCYVKDIHVVRYRSYPNVCYDAFADFSVFKNGHNKLVDPFIINVRHIGSANYSIHEGQDIRLPCPLIDNRMDLVAEVSWYLNGMPIRPTWRHNIHQKYVGGIWSEVLDISIFQDSDFGLYSCYVTLRYNDFDLDLDNTFILYTDKETVKFYNGGLIRSKTKFIVMPTIIETRMYVNRYLPVQVEQGAIDGLVKSSYMEFVLLDSIYEHIPLLNNIPLTEVCERTELTSCTVFIWMLNNVAMETVTRSITFETEGMAVVVSSEFHCSCPTVQKNLTVFMRRRFYNESSKKNEEVLIKGHITHMPVAKTEPLCVVKFATNSPEDTEVEMTDSLDSYISIFNIFIYSLSPFCLVTVIGYILLSILTCILKQFFVFLRKFLATAVFWQHKHEIYAACCSEDLERTVSVLDRVKDGRHRTYIHEVDSNPGQMEITGIETGLDRCCVYLIVVSTDSISCPMWQYQVNLIVSMLVRKEISASGVFVVRLDRTQYRALDDVTRVEQIGEVRWRKHSTDKCVLDVKTWLTPSYRSYQIFRKELSQVITMPQLRYWIMFAVTYYIVLVAYPTGL